VENKEERTRFFSLSLCYMTMCQRTAAAVKGHGHSFI
jgi:hypothetical protein